MKSSCNVALLAITLLCGSAVAADKPGEPGAHHQQLANHFVGKWNVEQTLWSVGAAPINELGTEVGELTFAGRHVISTLTSQFSGQPFTGVSIMSYDNDKRRYYSTWVDSKGVIPVRGVATRTIGLPVRIDSYVRVNRVARITAEAVPKHAGRKFQS